jgi:Protein of unknown function (DUF3034)
MLSKRARPTCAAAICGLALLLAAGRPARAGDRLLGAGGLEQLEGSAGGGLTPWALIAGLGTDREIGVSAFCTQVQPQDFRLDACGAAVGVEDRLELSIARQRLDLGATAPGQSLSQSILGAKLRLYGDAVIDQDRPWLPQLALGVQWKHNSDFDGTPRALGAHSASATDVYLAATKLWLAGPFARSWIADLTLRATEANQLGLLGFGGDLGSYHLETEASLGVFVSDHLVLGGEYREKPNNLSRFREDAFEDVFLAWLPVKYVSLTVAFVDLGNIANRAGQSGSYVSLQASF